MINRYSIFFHGTNDTLNTLLGQTYCARNICKQTRWAIPRAPPPPRTRPMDLPHIRLANREKSLIWGNRCGRMSAGPRRYFWISICTFSFKFFSAITASGSLGRVDLVIGTTSPWFWSLELMLDFNEKHWPAVQHGYADESMADSGTDVRCKHATFF